MSKTYRNILVLAVALALAAVLGMAWLKSRTVDTAAAPQTAQGTPAPEAAAPAPISTTAGPEPTPVAIQGREEQDAFYANAKVLEEQKGTPDTQGYYARTRLVEMSGEKHRLLRVSETWLVDPATGKEHLADRVSAPADHVIIRLAEGSNADQLGEFVRSRGGILGDRMPDSDAYVVQIPQPTLGAFERMLDNLNVPNQAGSYAEPDYLMSH